MEIEIRLVVAREDVGLDEVADEVWLEETVFVVVINPQKA